MTKILGLITARGGSKRVPRKNVKNFCGKPLIVWSIEVGNKSKIFDRFILSSEDKDIIKIAKNYGVDVPFKRPLNLAGDKSSSFSVVKHAVEWLRINENFVPDWIILLEPSSPGRQLFHLKEVSKIILSSNFNYDSLVGITKVPDHFHFSKQLKKEKNGKVVRVGDGEGLNSLIHRSQDLSDVFYINSSIYAFKKNNLYFKKPSLWGKNTYGYVMDEKYSLDINTPDDWLLAEYKMKNIIKK